ncbi:MAG: exosome complex RNA-binding protein Csl4 [Candidatus Hydrothermarchaeales archaeon]
MVESKEFVFPGRELGFSEEFIAGDGTYEEDGKIYANITGSLVVDPEERKISVAPKTSTIPIIKNGDLVIGNIVDVKQQFAIVDILKLKGIDRALPGSLSGSIHISQVRDSYVSDLSKEIRAGDVVLAKVVNTSSVSIQLATMGKELGVLRAFCYSCNRPVVKLDDKLKCENCGRIEERKLSPDYGKMEV